MFHLSLQKGTTAERFDVNRLLMKRPVPYEQKRSISASNLIRLRVNRTKEVSTVVRKSFRVALKNQQHHLSSVNFQALRSF